MTELLVRVVRLIFLYLLLQVENTIRWRARRDEDGNETRESNARIVKWSDGRCGFCRLY